MDRRLVHKEAIADVFITGSSMNAGGAFAITAQWPRRHWHFGTPSVRLNPLLVIETLRQACLVLAHSHLDVPQESHVLIEEVRVDHLAPRIRTDRPVELRIHGELSSLRTQFDIARRLSLSAGFDHGNERFAAVAGSAIVMSPSLYARLRRRRETVVERRREFGERLVQLDRTHPVYFDHPTDHVPGLMLIDEALRAASGIFLRTWEPTAIAARFDEFVELDVPATVRVEHRERLARGHHRSALQIRQAGRSASQMTIEFRVPAPHVR